MTFDESGGTSLVVRSGRVREAAYGHYRDKAGAQTLTGGAEANHSTLRIGNPAPGIPCSQLKRESRPWRSADNKTDAVTPLHFVPTLIGIDRNF